MRRRRIATDIAQQQIRTLSAQAGRDPDDLQADIEPAAPVGDILVMGDDGRPYLVKRAVVQRGDGAWVSWVSVSEAGWGRRRPRPVVGTTITLPPRPISGTVADEPRPQAICTHRSARSLRATRPAPSRVPVAPTARMSSGLGMSGGFDLSRSPCSRRRAVGQSVRLWAKVVLTTVRVRMRSCR